MKQEQEMDGVNVFEEIVFVKIYRSLSHQKEGEQKELSFFHLVVVLPSE